MKTIRVQHIGKQLEVGKILCVGKNYAEHVKEMNSDVPESPVLFIKPSSAIISNGESIRLPKISKMVHHEVELVIAIGKTGKHIAAKNAHDIVLGYAIGLDMTLRDIQNEAKKKGLPWSVAKGFDTSAPVSDIISKEEIADPDNLSLRCTVNGIEKQKGSTRDMIFSTGKIIEYISSIFTLEPGDLIFTGTPEGVGQVTTGDVIEAELVGLAKITHPVIAE